MTKIQPIFQANDGTKYEDADSAERHNEFLEAREKFDAAWRALKRVAIREFKTVDGYDFDYRGFLVEQKCYLITGEYSLYPGVVAVSLYPREISDISVQEGKIKITARIYSHGNSDLKTFSLSDLYKRKENAQKRLVEILKERIADFESQIEEVGKLL